MAMSWFVRIQLAGMQALSFAFARIAAYQLLSETFGFATIIATSSRRPQLHDRQRRGLSAIQ